MNLEDVVSREQKHKLTTAHFLRMRVNTLLPPFEINPETITILALIYQAQHKTAESAPVIRQLKKE